MHELAHLRLARGDVKSVGATSIGSIGDLLASLPTGKRTGELWQPGVTRALVLGSFMYTEDVRSVVYKTDYSLICSLDHKPYFWSM